MAARNGVWGIEIGQCALKAVKLRPADDGMVELAAFDLIEHPKILSQPDAEPEELIKAAVEKFISRNEWQKDQFVIGVPGQQIFARFCKLPPVDPKKIPEIVKFEAGQQIPFDINDVVWDYQVFQTKDSPDVEVGIFAMKNDLVRKQLEYFSKLGSSPVAIQSIPAALYNFCKFDGQGQFGEREATIIVDVGAQTTDLIIVEANSAWTRNIPLGGNTFTDALVKAFKLSFSKAENLKRTAADSKYARQVFQAMRPVFADLVAEIQRSLGFYSSTHRDVELKTVLASGNAFQLPGLQKYLENNLTISSGVTKLEKFNKLVPTAETAAPNFADNVLSLGAAYGLALQGLGLASIGATLLPPALARVQMWTRKKYYFMATAACLGLSCGFPFMRSYADLSALDGGKEMGRQAKALVDKNNEYVKQFGEAQKDSGGKQQKIEQLFGLQKNASLIPLIISVINDSLPEVSPDLAAADTPEKLKQVITRIPRNQRGQILIENLHVTYHKNIENVVAEDQPVAAAEYSSGGGAAGAATGGAALPSSGGRGGAGGGRGGQASATQDPSGQDAAPADAPGFLVQLNLRVLQGKDQGEVTTFISNQFYPRLLKLGSAANLPFHIPEEDAKSADTQTKRNLRAPNPQQRTPAAAAAGGGRGSSVGGGGRIGRGGIIDPSPTTPPPDEANAKPTVVDPDPVTGEERKDDWHVSLAFKIKLGAAPPKQPADGSAPSADGANAAPGGQPAAAAPQPANPRRP